MTIHRPALSAEELDHTREAWELAQIGKPIPGQYRPAASKVAGYCLARAYDHDDVADARPLFIHPDGGREGHPGIYGTNQTWDVCGLAAWIAKTTRTPRAKGTGWMFSPGHSWAADTDGAAPFPLGPRQRTDARCRSLGWLLFDADGVGEWTATANVLGMMSAAYVRSRSSGHCTLPSCDAKGHRGGAVKWHLALPLRAPWAPPENVNAARAQWKGELYPAARFVLHVLGELSGKGFDRPLDQLLARMYVGAPCDLQHWRVPREVSCVEGLGFDVRACWAGLEELGVVDPVEARAERERRSAPAGSGAWTTDEGAPPMVAAFHAAGLYVRPLSNGNHAVACPWESTHTSGRTGDTSTVLFPNGIFHCSHSHPEGKGAGGMREVLAMLPVDAQAAHIQARPRRAPVAPATGRPPPCTPDEARDEAYRALLGALQLSGRDRADLRARGLCDAAIVANGYRSLPPGGREALADAVVMAVGADAAAGVPGLARTPDGWMVVGWPGLLIPVRGLAGRITALMVRRLDGSEAPITSRKQGGAPAVRAVHVPLAARSMRDRALVITLGALAADVATALADRPVVSIPGAAAWRLALDVVDAWGAHDVAVAFDADARSNPNVARALVCLVDALRASGARVSTWRWDGPAKGLDDYLSARRRGEMNHGL